MLLRARDRHVEDPPLLLLRRHASLGLDALEPCAVHGAAAEPGQAQAHAAVLRDPQRAVVVTAVLAEIGQADHGELEALGAVHGHHPHGVERLRLERRLALARLDRVPFREGVDEAAQVAPLVRLVLARHPHELADVGHAARAAGEGQQVAVVARERDGAVDQRLQRDLAGDPPLRLEAIGKRRKARPVLDRQLVEQLGVRLAAAAPERGAQRPPRVAAGGSAPAARSARRRRARGRRVATRERE